MLRNLTRRGQLPASSVRQCHHIESTTPEMKNVLSSGMQGLENLVALFDEEFFMFYDSIFRRGDLLSMRSHTYDICRSSYVHLCTPMYTYVHLCTPMYTYVHPRISDVEKVVEKFARSNAKSRYCITELFCDRATRPVTNWLP